ncbi:Helix-turn-helix protein [Bacillus sp. THAF10]|uniref:helix-turn-helix domain-containing protein n=1 Tax=Bacillus sp. THAF10 TaxID=2587848 RepID=UPI0012684759|nr:helix-turn-helix transcriptional regulator [Bacillus sp. THAF10]QFT90841.1 Helix-turn-helix protein [Bacillus sp. THAF10]
MKIDSRAIGNALRKLRLEHGWKQEELEEYANLSETMLGKIERGEREPLLTTFIKICKNSKQPINAETFINLILEENNKLQSKD